MPSVKITQPKRLFRYNGIDYPDPAPGQSAEQAVELLALAHPALTNATIEPGKPEAGALVYELKATLGTKG